MGFLDGKVTVITGAGSGMGKASAKIFVREGPKAAISEITGADEQTRDEIGGAAVLARHCDIRHEHEASAMIALAISKFGRVDVMLNVGGAAPRGHGKHGERSVRSYAGHQLERHVLRRKTCHASHERRRRLRYLRLVFLAGFVPNPSITKGLSAG